MEQYLGVKLISAEKATRTEGELSNEGYTVIYEDGYRSWSPKDVFEKAYRKINLDLPDFKLPIADHQNRVIEETLELKLKVSKLETFIFDNPIFIKLDKTEQVRLQQQLMAMKYYLTILIERIENFK